VAVLDQSAFGGRPADVEHDQIGLADLAAEIGGGKDPAGRAGSTMVIGLALAAAAVAMPPFDCII
jgi:hypothetical protein